MMQYDMALSCYEKAAANRPMYAEAYCNMGVIYKNRGDLDAAISCYERCVGKLRLVFLFYTVRCLELFTV